jgi:hypothetical protein
MSFVIMNFVAVYHVLDEQGLQRDCDGNSTSQTTEEQKRKSARRLVLFQSINSYTIRISARKISIIQAGHFVQKIGQTTVTDNNFFQIIDF